MVVRAVGFRQEGAKDFLFGLGARDLRPTPDHSCKVDKSIFPIVKDLPP